jgi:hypothetical protein
MAIDPLVIKIVANEKWTSQNEIYHIKTNNIIYRLFSFICTKFNRTIC